ncbi:uncharacterized protein LOC142240839 [Haematobia irritans]|uniref:uncharacterized protein LOC142240839 n=1 Tax=Haematobia irritans TaxID=7368 RepID=UPI003F4FDD8D
MLSSRLNTDLYQKTFMEQFCNSIHPKINLASICISWFQQTTEHCRGLINNTVTPSIWRRVKNFIFTYKNGDLMSHNQAMWIHPDYLTLKDCQILYDNIVKDYVHRNPRYVEELTENEHHRELLFSMIVVSIISALIGMFHLYLRYQGFKRKIPNTSSHEIESILEPTKCLQAVAKRSLRLAKYQIQHLKIESMISPEELIASDGSPILAIKVHSKLQFMESYISGSLNHSSHIFNVNEDCESTIVPEIETETRAKALKLLEGSCKKLHVLLLFENDDESTYGESESDQQINEGVYKNIEKSMTKVNTSETILQSRTLTVDIIGDSDTPRSTLVGKRKPNEAIRKTSLCKRMGTSNTSTPRKRLIEGIRSASASSSPKKSTTSPRPSGIPISKRPPSPMV